MLTEPTPRVADGRSLDLDELDAWLIVQGLLVIEWQPGLTSPALGRDELARIRELAHRVAPLLPTLDDHAESAESPTSSAGSA